ncbi:MAG: flagellar hook capping FlgD N-terminal domain-containing protein, partial [Pseudomonadota bacterium]
MEVTGTPETAAGNATATAKSQLTSDFNTFLQLLTAQVNNQDPLEPLDSTQFVEQLATFSALEQQINTNSQLDTITGLLQGALGAQGASLIGKTATA